MKKFLIPMTVMVVSMTMSLGFLEVFLRVKHKKSNWENFIAQEWNFLSAGFPVIHDPTLGWVTKPNVVLEKDRFDRKLTLLAKGIRSNGFAEDTKKNIGNGSILVVGASHAFGTEVSDDETWESYLQRSLGVPVVNAAVFGFGIDQMVLRFEQVAPVVKPSIGILAFHPDNIGQCEMAQKYAKKPFFEIESNELVLKNTPVPETKRELTPLQAVFGYSLLFHTIGNRWLPTLWRDSRGDLRVHENGEKVSCKLIQRFAQFSHSKGIRPIVLVQYWKDVSAESSNLADRVISCAKASETFDVLDLSGALKAMRQRDEGRYDAMFQMHMSAEGNRFVALQLEQFLTTN